MPEIYDSTKHEPENKPNETSEIKKRDVKDYSEVMRAFKHTTNPLATFVVRPKNVRLSIQEGEEKVLLLLRRHFITNTGWILVVLAMALAPFFVNLFPIINFLPLPFSLATTMLWYLLTLGVALEGFLSWYYNVFIITDERVIDVDFLNLIYKNVSAAKINNIEDVTVRMGGALRSVLNFGTVLIQTAAEKTQFEFEDVPKPQDVAKFLNELMLEEEREELEGRVR